MKLSEVREVVKDEVDDDNIETGFLNEAINKIRLRIARDSRVKWKFLEDTVTFETVPGQKDYAKSAIAQDLGTVYDIFHDGNQLRSLSAFEISQINGSEATGVPAAYYEWDGNLSLYPAPSDTRTVTVRHYRELQKISADDDETGIPEKYEDVLVTGVKMLFYEQDEDTTRYDRAKLDFKEALKDAVDSEDTTVNRTYILKRAKNYGAFRPGDYGRK